MKVVLVLVGMLGLMISLCASLVMQFYIISKIDAAVWVFVLFFVYVPVMVVSTVMINMSK